MRPTLAQMILAANGRYAIMARSDVDAPWVQVESIAGSEHASRYVDDLENDDDVREEVCRDHAGENWGDDAPPRDWQSAA